MENNNVFIKENSELRKTAREQLKGNWGIAILICLLSSIVSGGVSFIPYVKFFVPILVSGPLALGVIACFMNLVRKEPFNVETMFDGFRNFLSAFLLQLFMGIFIFLWMLLLIVPGIIAALKYSMSFYILNDNPEIKPMEAIKQSKKMMDGYKWKFFCLLFSFFGWFLLSILTIGIGLLWLIPYMKATTANFYQNLKDNLEDNLVEPIKVL